MNFKKTIATVLFFIFVTIMVVVVVRKNKLYDNKYFYITIFILIFFVMLIFLIFAVSAWFQPRSNRDNDYDIDYFIGQVNRKFSNMAETQSILWKGGRETRFLMQYFKVNDKAELFMGLTGERSGDFSNVNVVCLVNEDTGKVKIRRFIGNPGKDMIKNPLYKFDPNHKDGFNLMNNYYNTKAKRRNNYGMPPVIIQGGGNNELAQQRIEESE